jgi:DNA-binding LacI/PurR family transcriptional regulator
MDRATTMADIAADVGVSRQLVSMVLRDLPGPSADTHERVMEAAKRLGYTPHFGARALRQSTSTQIGVVFAPTHETEQDIVESIYATAADQGYGVVLTATTSSHPSSIAIEDALGYRCAALIIIGADLPPSQLSALSKRTPGPVVNVGAGRKNRSYDVVRSAGDNGIALCVQHLIDVGHRKIVYVDAESMPWGRARLSGYERVMTANRLRKRVIRVSGDYTEESGSTAARELLAGGALPTAIVAGNDQAALGLMLTFARAGIRIPDDVSVTGYDDSRFAALSSVDLTTARQDPVEMGRLAVQSALRRVLDPGQSPIETVIEPTLVVRGSTSPPSR